MAIEINQTIEDALQELIGDISQKPSPADQDTYICDMIYHAIHCFSCGWTGVVFDLADLTDPDKFVSGMLFTPRTESFCPQCSRSVKRAQGQRMEPPKSPIDRCGLRLAEPVTKTDQLPKAPDKT